MSCGFMVVAACEDSVTDGVIIRDVHTVFVGENPSFMLPVREAGAESEGDGTIHRLESLEYERIVGRGRLDFVCKGGVDYSDEE